jgi:hypothetical protein
MLNMALSEIWESIGISKFRHQGLEVSKLMCQIDVYESRGPKERVSFSCDLLKESTSTLHHGEPTVPILKFCDGDDVELPLQ